MKLESLPKSYLVTDHEPNEEVQTYRVLLMGKLNKCLEYCPALCERDSMKWPRLRRKLPIEPQRKPLVVVVGVKFYPKPKQKLIRLGVAFLVSEVLRRWKLEQFW
jgi:hypothetical protein